MNYQTSLWGRLCRWATIIGVVLLPWVGLTSSSALAQTAAEEFTFYLGQERVDLELSTEIVAVRFVEGLTHQEIKALVEAETSLQPLAEGQELPELGLFLLRVREGVSRAGLLRLLASLNSRVGVAFANPVFRFPDAQQTMTDEFIAQFKAEVSQEAISEFNAANGVEIVQELAWVAHTYILRVSPGNRVLETANLYAESGLVRYAEPNWVRLLKKATAPNDTHYPEQWGMENTGTNPPDGVGTPDADIDAEAAWDMSAGSPDIVIAIVDEGVELDHEDLDSKIVADYSAIPGDPNGGDPNNTWDAHGTNCAGIAAAETNNNQGVAGVCWGCSLMAVQIAYSPEPGGDWMITSDSWQADGMTWAVDHGADVLSNSWDGGSPSSLINNAIHHAVTQGRDGLGSVVLFASGNDDETPVSYPASNNETIAVGATSPCDERKNPTSCDGEDWWGSNYGSDLDIVAPGVEWWATDLMGSAGHDPSNYFDHFNGTSSATSTAAGLAGLILSYKPCLSEVQVQEIMEQSADDQVGLSGEDTPGWDQYMGWGRINATKALSLTQETPCSDWHIETVDSGDAGSFTSLALDASGDPHISYYDWDNYDLKYAYWDGSAWQIETVDSDGDVGWGTSLVLDAAGYPHISYFDATNHDLKYARWDGAAWHIETVDSDGDVGWCNSLALDAEGYPHISYYDYGGNANLKYARWDGLAWHIETVDSEGDVGKSTSLALDAGGYPHIGYYDDLPNWNLKYARWDGSAWHIETVDSEGDVGKFISLALDAGGYPHIGYYDYSDRDLKYARWDGAAWHIETVDSYGDVGSFASLALDAAGYPHISYNDYDPNYDLKYAHWDGSAWHIETWDKGGDVGFYTSLALDTAGHPHISYYGPDDLKYAWRGAPHASTTISVYTDEASYSAGETMRLGLDMTTAAGGSPLPYWLLILLRTPSTGVVVFELHGLPLPPGWSYFNPDFLTFPLPALEPGIYTWIGVLVPVGEEPAVDLVIWTFTGGEASGQRVVPVEKALEQLGEIDLNLGK